MSMSQQVELALQSITQGDVDLLSKVFSDPATITPDEHRTVAEKLGLKGGFLAAAVNTIADPVVLLSFYLSRAFPMKDFLLGTVPKRYIGAGNEFSGISLFTRPVEGFFRGTNISNLSALATRRMAEVMRVGSKIFDATLSRGPAWKQEMPIVSLLLEGQRPPGATPELIDLSKKIRGNMEELWGMLRQAHRVHGGFVDDRIERASVGSFPTNEAPRYIRDYLPHIPLTTNESMIETSAKGALTRMLRSRGVAQALENKGEDITKIWTPDKTDRLQSDFGRWQAFMNNAGAQIYNERLIPRVRTGLVLQSDQGHELFVTDLNVILQKYVHGVARTYALGAPISNAEKMMAWSRAEGWKPPTNEPVLVQIINEGLESTGARFRQERIAGTNITRDVAIDGSFKQPYMTALKGLVRSIRGMQDEGEIMFGGLLNSIRHKTYNSLKNLGVPDRHINWMDRGIDITGRNDGYRTINNKIASHFYASTLGLNAWSTFQNFLQPAITTMPSIGIGATMKGYKVLSERLPNYARGVVDSARRFRQLGMRPLQALNHGVEESFHRTFPELAQQGIKISPSAFDIDEEALIERGVFRHGAFGHVDDFYKAVLQPFTQAEVANQVSTFYGAKAQLETMAKVGDLPDGINFDFAASGAVNALQFRPGPGSRSWFQSFLPAPFRMFTSYPMRLASFIGESTVRGAMTQEAMNQARFVDWMKDPLLMTEAGRAGAQKAISLGTGRNLGTISRLMLYGRILQHGFSDVLGVDVSGSLGVAAPYMQFFQSDQPFAPLPLSPLPSMIHGLYSAATSRDMKRMQPMVVPGIGEVPVPKTLFPAGLAISRFARALNQYRPDVGGFVDEDERLMFQGNTTDMLLAGLGVPLEKQKRMRDKIDVLYANRKAIRDYRRRFATAAMGGDIVGMDQLRGDFSKAFPDMPPLSISHQDLRRYREQANIPAVSRMVRTLGRGARYLESDIYEYDPDLVAPPLPGLLGARAA